MISDSRDKKSANEILNDFEISSTPIRILVIKCLQESDTPLSLIEIETRLATVERSSISRTLSLFKKQNVVHSFDDGSGSAKYELCKSNKFSIKDLHIHFRCQSCEKTFCFETMKIPDIELPEGFMMKDANFVITGLCDNCNRNNPH